jgi:hypothetical protein
VARARLGVGSAIGRRQGEALEWHIIRALKAHVRGGRLVLDEPTNLPEGAEVRVALVDGDELNDQERAELHTAILAAEAELDAGQAATEEDLWVRLGAAR